MSENVNCNNRNSLIEDPPQLDDDLGMIKAWARDELFQFCKFLYSEKDVAPNGKVYKIFESQCLQKLTGVKAAKGDEQKIKHYTRTVWDMATNKNIVSNVLNVRRSGVYSVMRNRFNGTCECGFN
jgi:hypothetical protein